MSTFGNVLRKTLAHLPELASALQFFVMAIGTLAAWPASSDDRLALFDEVASEIAAEFYDPDMHGVDWAALSKQYRGRITPDMDREAFAETVNELLSRLNASHTRLLTRDSPDWYQVAGIFVGGYEPLRLALDDYLVDGIPVYTGIGVMLESGSEGHFVIGVLDGFPARESGILVGDRIDTVEGIDFHPIRSFLGSANMDLRMTVERRPGEIVDLEVTPVMIDATTMFEDAMRESARVIEKGAMEIGYIRAWSYAGQRYQDLLVGELTNGSLKDADALVLDLRGGWGGASPQYLNFFVARSIEASSITRDGEAFSFSSGWSRPVVLLVDGGSRSGKELLAHGFRALGKGPIVGETTAGAVLAGRIGALSDGSLLYVAVADVVVDGVRIEGRGVKPDIEVAFERRFAAGVDLQLERSIEIAAELAGSGESPGSR